MKFNRRFQKTHNLFRIACWFWPMLLVAGSCSKPQAPAQEPLALIQVTTNPGGMVLNTTDSILAERFEWAAQQALSYAHSANDPVGKWYEAALPDREAFCMRDVSHQSTGAHYLGLQDHNKNMLLKFAENISESKDWCSYWEINKDNVPASVDYANDQEFWYNLPANFDVLIACWKQYLLTSDPEYLDHPAFVSFYHHTMTDFITSWQLDPDSVMSRDRFMNLKVTFDPSNSFHYSRGLPSYGEAEPLELFLGADLLCLQFQAYKVYGTMLKLKSNEIAMEQMYGNAKRLGDMFNTQWWDTTAQYYHSSKLIDGSYNSNPSRYLLQSGIYQTQKQYKRSLEHLLQRKSVNIESQSYLPKLYYQEDEDEKAYQEILDLSDPAKARREYPEVSYAIIEALLEGTMGIRSDAVTQSVMTFPRLTSATAQIGFENIPLYDGTINVTHLGSYQSIFENKTTEPINWKITFPTGITTILVKGLELQARVGVTQSGKEMAQAEYVVEPGEKVTATVMQ